MEKMCITFFVDLFKSLNFSLKLFSLKSIFSEMQGIVSQGS